MSRDVEEGLMTGEEFAARYGSCKIELVNGRVTCCPHDRAPVEPAGPDARSDDAPILVLERRLSGTQGTSIYTKVVKHLRAGV